MDGEHFLQVVSRRLGLAPPMHLSKTPAARDLHAIAELLAARAPLGVALVLDAASQHLGGLVLDARHRVCADAFTPRSVRQELRAAGSEAAAAEAVANVAVEAMAEARFRHGQSQFRQAARRYPDSGVAEQYISGRNRLLPALGKRTAAVQSPTPPPLVVLRQHNVQAEHDKLEAVAVGTKQVVELGLWVLLLCQPEILRAYS